MTPPQFSKFNNFLWVCWFLGNNLLNFVSPDLKLHNRYCHTFAFFCQIVVHGIGTYKHFLTIIVFKGSLQCQYSHWLVSRRTKDFQIFGFWNNGNLKKKTSLTMNYFWCWMCLKKYLCFGQQVLFLWIPTKPGRQKDRTILNPGCTLEWPRLWLITDLSLVVNK